MAKKIQQSNKALIKELNTKIRQLTTEKGFMQQTIDKGHAVLNFILRKT